MITALGLAAALTAQPVPEPGVWRSQGYGYVLDVGPKGAQLYDFDGGRCVRGDFIDDLSDMGAVTPTGSGRFLLTGDDMHIGFERITGLPKACDWPSGPSADPLVNFDALWAMLDEHYPFFAARGVDWKAVRREYRPKVQALGPNGDPWPIFVEMLSKLRDPHTRLVDGQRRFQARRGDASPIAPIQAALPAYLAKPESPLAGKVETLAHERLVFGRTPDDVGYIAVPTMGGFDAGPVGWPANTSAAADQRAATQALTAAFGRLAGVRGLILDLRFNPGGSEAFADLIAGCFADRKRLAYAKAAKDGAGQGPAYEAYVEPGACPRFEGPVVVLVGERTTSAAEALVMRLRVLPGVTVMGRPTQGAHSEVLDKTLPNGWRLGLSNEIYRLADGKVYEGVGIPPAILTPATSPTDPDEVRFGRDIRAAQQRLRP